MSNPYPRAERYSHVAIERLDGWVHSWWVCAHERRLSGVADLRLAASAALRIRHGARAACKRLRGERDEARAGYRWMVEQAADQKLDGYRELGARAAAAENERDAARLELRALEWMTVRGYAVGRSETGARVIVRPLRPTDPTCFRSWAEAARALGWEG